VILAIDTSTYEASVAICRGEQPLAEISWRSDGRHSRRAMPAIRQVLALAATAPGDLSTIAAAIGPGSFNGLRAGLSIAKGMALALDVPLVGISTLDVIGFQAVTPHRGVLAAVPAGRGEVCCARFRLEGSDLKRASEYARLKAGAALGLLQVGDHIAGPGRGLVVDAAREAGIEVAVEPAFRDLRRASYLAELARRFMDAGGKSQINDVEPLYLRRSSAEERRSSAVQE
jgi:tRNA threonylcarbamoyladenosine biosynthesis protein TsaB